MDTNLDDSLNLENAMVEFEHSEDTVVNQADISFDASGHEESIPMEYENIEEQPILMDTGNEEIIVSDFMGDQLILQDYGSQGSQGLVEHTNTISEENVMTTQSEELLQPDQTISVPASGLITQERFFTSRHQQPITSRHQQPISVQASGLITTEPTLQPKIIAIKAGGGVGAGGGGTLRAIAARGGGGGGSKPAPRQVAIAPKPSKIVQGAVQKVTLGPGKQYTIAPKPLPGVKPVTLVANTHAIQAASKANTLLTLGKQQVVVMPSSQKLKLLSARAMNVQMLNTTTTAATAAANTTADEQAQLIQNVSTSQAQGNKVMKVVVQGSQADSNAPAVITKLVSVTAGGGGGAGGTGSRLVTLNKQQQLSIGNNKVMIASPTRTGGIRYMAAKKPQLIAIKSPSSSLITTTPTQGLTTKKVIVSANSGSQNVVLKAAPKLANVPKVTAGQKTQLHQINVPGKGIQYIRLVTNPTVPAASKPAPSPSPALPAPPALPALPALAPASSPAPLSAAPHAASAQNKTFVLSDGKGNLIHMTAEKVMSSQQPPPLIVTSSASASKVAGLSKPPHKLVRLAPLSSKLGQAAMSRGGQSLLAPLSPQGVEPTPSRVTEELEAAEDTSQLVYQDKRVEQQDQLYEECVQEQEAVDSKTTLRALIADSVGLADNEHIDNTHAHHAAEVEVHYDKQQNQEYEDSSSSVERGNNEHPLIVIPPYMKQEMLPAEQNNYENSQRMSGLINVQVDAGGSYDYSALSNDQTLSDSDMVPTELGLRPRKACNCTKSQCLKLYCDCFANGEFCNRCNCNNCHNNLENEELRQKAIRGCLDRNPNAFRPKIGKSKASGQDHFRRHNKGCNCKRSGCLKNYCECYEAKIACTNICKCVGCRNVEEGIERARRRDTGLLAHQPAPSRAAARPAPTVPVKQPCSFMTTEVIEAVCQCLIAAAVESGPEPPSAPSAPPHEERDPVRDVIEEFARCLQDIISASHQAQPVI